MSRSNRRNNLPRNQRRRGNGSRRPTSTDQGFMQKAKEKKDVIGKKFSFVLFYIVINVAPYIDLDYFRFPLINQVFKYLVGFPSGFIGDSFYRVGDKIPVLGFFIKRLANAFWFFEPFKEVEMLSLSYLFEEGVTKAFEKLFIMYWDEILEIVAGIATAGIGGAFVSAITLLFDSSFWKMSEELGWDEKLIDHGPHWLAHIGTVFLMRSHGNNESTGLNTNSQNNRIMTDGGEDQSRYDEYRRANNRSGMNSGNVSGNNRSRDSWGDIQTAEQSNSSIDLSSIPFSPVKIIAVVFLVGFTGFLGFSVLGSGGGVFGVAADYTGANFDTPNILEGVSYSVSKAGTTLSCLGDAGCVREWQLNNTRRPGSEDVGETYSLNVRNFQVFGSGNGVDVAYNRPDSPVPVYFLVQNTRNGLKGIDARNVQYRVSVRDEGLLSGQNYCSTNWIDLDNGLNENTLIPGEAAEPVGWQNQLTLERCGMLQPSAGNYLNFVLEVKYDYSSKSTLYVEAMSREHRRSQQIPIEFKNSETADTPVETYIETRQPIMFNEQAGERQAIPFSTRVGVTTDENNIEYKIDEEKFRFEDSVLTEVVEGSCRGLQNTEGNSYELSQDAKDRITNRQKDGYFNKDQRPGSASCTLKISEDALNSISRTGETLTMSADVNYTIKLEEKEESFQLFNSRCSTANCPQLVPLKGNNLSSEVLTTNLRNADPEEQNKQYWAKQYATCNGPDDNQNGCSVIESFRQTDRSVSLGEVNEGEIAIDMQNAESVSPTFVTCHVRNNVEIGAENRIAGINEDRVIDALESDNAINYTNTGDWRVVRLGRNDPRPPTCSTETSTSDNPKYWERDYTNY